MLRLKKQGHKVQQLLHHTKKAGVPQFCMMKRNNGLHISPFPKNQLGSLHLTLKNHFMAQTSPRRLLSFSRPSSGFPKKTKLAFSATPPSKPSMLIKNHFYSSNLQLNQSLGPSRILSGHPSNTIRFVKTTPVFLAENFVNPSPPNRHYHVEYDHWAIGDSQQISSAQDVREKLMTHLSNQGVKSSIEWLENLESPFVDISHWNLLLNHCANQNEKDLIDTLLEIIHNQNKHYDIRTLAILFRYYAKRKYSIEMLELLKLLSMKKAERPAHLQEVELDSYILNLIFKSFQKYKYKERAFSEAMKYVQRLELKMPAQTFLQYLQCIKLYHNMNSYQQDIRRYFHEQRDEFDQIVFNSALDCALEMRDFDFFEEVLEFQNVKPFEQDDFYWAVKVKRFFVEYKLDKISELFHNEPHLYSNAPAVHMFINCCALSEGNMELALELAENLRQSQKDTDLTSITIFRNLLNAARIVREVDLYGVDLNTLSPASQKMYQWGKTVELQKLLLEHKQQVMKKGIKTEKTALLLCQYYAQISEWRLLRFFFKSSQYGVPLGHKFVGGLLYPLWLNRRSENHRKACPQYTEYDLEVALNPNKPTNVLSIGTSAQNKKKQQDLNPQPTPQAINLATELPQIIESKEPWRPFFKLTEQIFGRKIITRRGKYQIFKPTFDLHEEIQHQDLIYHPLSNTVVLSPKAEAASRTDSQPIVKPNPPLDQATRDSYQRLKAILTPEHLTRKLEEKERKESSLEE